LDRDLIPVTYQLLHVLVSEDVAIEVIDSELPADWRTEIKVSRELGDGWLDQSSSALLQVPSAISERGKNFLLNPVHADAAKITVAEIIKAPFDPRLLSGSS
jgi:RES domain-containing protein